MLRYFPVAYEDELLYSQIARYHRHSCSPGYKQTISELFGSKTVAAVVDLPAHLERLQQHTGHITRQSAEDTLWQQTLFPVYAPFLEPELVRRVKESMLSDYGGDIHTRAGIAASRIKRMEFLRICPVCWQEQCCLNGEAYWQRLFQVSGVLVCPVHRQFLQNTAITYSPFNKHQFTPVPPFAADHHQCSGFSETDIDKLTLVAQDMQQLLVEKFSPQGHAHWTAKYKRLLADKGMTKGKNVRQHDFHEGFLSFWGRRVLNALSCNVDAKDEHGWLAAMARKHRKNNHPLQHILIYRYLAGKNAPLTELFRPCPQQPRKAPLPKPQGQYQTDAEENKRRWLELQKRYPQLYSKALRKLSPALYARLYRQDRDWLLQNTPRSGQITSVNSRVNWQQRDSAIARQVIRAAKRYQKSDASPRISKKLLAQSAGYLSSIEKHLKLLPITRKVLNKYSESITEYQCRRIDRTVAMLQQNNERIVSWKIYRKANIRADVSQEVKAYIKKKTDESARTSQI